MSIVKVSVVDANGNLLKDLPAKQVRLRVKGPGNLLATGNAARNINAPGVRSSLAKGNPSTYRGVCQAIVRSTGKPGTVTVSATANGLRSAEVTVKARPDIDPFDVIPANLKPAADQFAAILPRQAFDIQSVQLPDEHVKADVSVSARIQVRNLSSFYPLKITMQLSGRDLSAERFSIPLGETRDIVVAGPRLYQTGQHDISVIFSRNGNNFHKVSRTINIAETPAAFFVDSSSILKSVFPNERLTIRAAVRNTGSKPSRKLEIPMSLNGKLQPTTAPDLQPGETRELEFKVAIPGNGVKHHLTVAQFESDLAVIQPPASADAFEFYGSPRQTGDSEKAIWFNGTNDFAELKNPIDLKDKAFTICLWFRHQHPDKHLWDRDAILISGRKGGLRAGINRQKDPFFAFGTNSHWRHPKPKRNEWTFHCYQLQATHLPQQTGGADDGSLPVQEATWEMAMRIYVNGKRDQAKKMNDNTFYRGSFSTIAGSVSGGRFTGEIGDLKVYLRALDGDEIRQLYEEGHATILPAVRDSLVFWSTFDDKSFALIEPQKFVLKEIDDNKYPRRRRVYLQLKEAVSAKQGWNTPKQDKSVQSNPIRIADTTYKRGIGTHSPGEIIYNLSGYGFQRFYARVGVDDESSGTLGYEVHVDGKLAFESGHMTRGDEAKTVDVDIAGAKQLQLIVTTGVDNQNDGDHAAWADACFIQAESAASPK